MCRYAMTIYKPHYACFNCQKTFKRRLAGDIERSDLPPAEAKCPQCGSLMADMGLDFESPRKNDHKAWRHIRELYSVGITFHSCGCTGPGYIPNSHERLLAYFMELKEEYEKNLDFWRKRTEPTSEAELNREYSKHWEHLRKVPGRDGKQKLVSNETARQYWLERINALQQKIDSIKQ